MTRPVLLILVLVVLSLCVQSCQEDINMLSFNPGKEVGATSSLYFTFDQDLVSPDSVGQWTSDQIIAFEPVIEGQFIWTSPRKLKFTPASPLPFDQEYQWSLQTPFFNAYRVSTSEENTFHTPSLNLENIFLTWSDRQDYYSGAPQIEARLGFNMPIGYGSLDNYVEVYQNGKPIRGVDTDYSSGAMRSIYWTAPDTVDEVLTFQVRILKGLAAEYEASFLKEDVLIEADLPPLGILKVTDVSTQAEAGMMRLTLNFNQPVRKKDFLEHLEVYPDQVYEVKMDGSEVTLEGSFKPGSRVLVRIRGGLRGVFGGTMEDDWERSRVLPEYKPFLRFADASGMYLQRNGFENILAKCVNIDSIDVRMYEIYENNLLHFLNHNGYRLRRNYWSSDEWDYLYQSGSDYSIRNYGKEIYRKMIHIDSSQRNIVQNIPIKIDEEQRRPYRGIFAVEITDPEEYYYREDAKIVCLSDLGIIAKRSGQAFTVFVHALSTALAVPGATVQLHSETNQVIASGNTNAQGVAQLVVREAMADFRPRLITVRTSTDFNFLDFDLTEIDQNDYDTDYYNPSNDPYQGFIYSESNLYRPGDTAHISAIVRDANWEVPGDELLFYEISNSSGQTVLEGKSRCNPQGGLGFELILPREASTGSYYVKLRTATQDPFAHHSFNVEEFVPDKIRVTLSPSGGPFLPGDTIHFPLDAKYYYGAPCDSHRYNVSYSFSHRPFYSQEYSDYHFGGQNRENDDIDSGEDDLFLNANGQDTLALILPDSISSEGQIEGTAVVEVFDNTGRTVRTRSNFEVHPRDHYLGLRLNGSYFNLGQTVDMDFVAIGNDDRPLPKFPLAIKVVRKKWNRVLRQRDQDLQYQSSAEDIVVYQDTVALNGDFHRYRFRPRASGNYEVILSNTDGTTITTRSFRAYGQQVASSTSFATQRSGQVEIIPDQSKYQTGETARILFTTPFSGRLLVTVERASVYQHHLLEVPENSAELRLPIREEFLPNVFISATLFRPQRYASQIPMTVAHGSKNISIRSQARELPVSITAPTEMRPGNPLKMSVQTTPGAYVTIAAVDEGILSIRNYQTPRPQDEFYKDRILQVKSYDLYQYLLPEVPSAEALTGGGYMAMLSPVNFLNPIQAERFKPLTFWSGVQPAGANGRVDFDIPVPKEFNGQIRLVAVAYKGNRFASAEKRVISRDNVVMTPGIPRFVTKGDSIVLPLNVINMTDASGAVDVDLSVDGPLEVVGSRKKTAQIGSRGGETIEFMLRTKDAVGVAHIRIAMRGLDNRVQEFEIAVRPPETRERIGGSGTIGPGDTRKFSIPAGYYPEFQQATITISNSLASRLGRDLGSLLQYPHGCVEQTTSKLFPQLYLPNLVGALAPGEISSGEIVQNVRTGITKLESMQLYDGSLSYWPGGSYSSWWGSVYAAHFLVEAEKKGFAVKKNVRDALLDYLEEEAGKEAFSTIQTFQNGQWREKTIVPKEIPYSLYVLAQAGRPALSVMNYHKSHADQISQDGRYLLAASYAVTGDMASFAEVIPPNFSPTALKYGSGSNFDSSIRSAALILNVLLDVAPEHPHTELFLNLILGKIDNIYSTQEQAWAFLALGKAASRSQSMRVEIWVDGKKAGMYKGSHLKLESQDWMGKEVELRGKGEGEVYYSWQIGGIPKGRGVQTKDRDQILRVHRKIYDMEGQPITKNIFQQGEMIAVRLRLRTDEVLEHVVVQDLLPAAFEVENPRLGETYSRPDFIDTYFSSSHIEYRDDRILYFVDLEPGEPQDLWYLVRVVNRGQFLRPPVAAESMYRPDAQSYHSGDTILVIEPDAPLPFRSVPSLDPSCEDPREARFRQLMETIGVDSSSELRSLIRKKLMEDG